MSELTKRIVFAVPAAAFFIWLAWLGGIYFNTLMGLLAVGTTWEVWRLLKQAGYPALLISSYALAVVLWFNAFLSTFFILGFGSAVILITILSLCTREVTLSRQWISTLFCGLYASLGFYLAVLVRDLGVEQQGFWLILALFFMIWGNDIFAYFGGKTFGKRKLAPNISPNKTWEGFGFGILGAAVGASIVWIVAPGFPLSLFQLLPAAMIVSITGPVGDLSESRLKRFAGMKDSSGLLPGHGGLFDRFDAMILTVPFLYFYFSIFM